MYVAHIPSNYYYCQISSEFKSKWLVPQNTNAHHGLLNTQHLRVLWWSSDGKKKEHKYAPTDSYRTCVSVHEILRFCSRRINTPQSIVSSRDFFSSFFFSLNRLWVSSPNCILVFIIILKNLIINFRVKQE